MIFPRRLRRRAALACALLASAAVCADETSARVPAARLGAITLQAAVVPSNSAR